MRATKNTDETITVHFLEADKPGTGFGTNAIQELFEKNPDTMLIKGETDEDARGFWEKIGARIGTEEGRHGEIIAGLSEETTGGLPQIKSTAMGTGQLVAMIVSRHLLNHQVPARVFASEDLRFHVHYDGESSG